MTTDTMALEGTSISLPAHAATLAWLNAFLATGDDAERPALYKTILLEIFDAGVQFVSCDGTLLFRAWTPSDGLAEWPILAESPNHSVVVMDPDGFGVGFMRTLHRLTGEEGHEFDELTLTVAAADEDDGEAALGPEFRTARVTLRASGQRIDLRVFDGPYPSWRVARLGIDAAERVDGLAVAPRMLGTVGKLKGCSRIDLEFFGEDKHIGFSAHGGGSLQVRGLIMPMRRLKEHTDE